MNRTRLYLVLAVLGALVPYLFFVDFIAAEGFADALGGGFVKALFVNGAAAGFTADVLISSLVFWIWMHAELRESGSESEPGPGSAPLWPFVGLNLTIGLSCALPAYLYFRARERERVEAGVSRP